MPCSKCKKPGHNAKTCDKQVVFNYLDDEGNINPIYADIGLEDWMIPDDIHYSECVNHTEKIWQALRNADKGDGLQYEEVIDIVRNVCKPA
jgi:hypothetical protein